MGPKEGTLMQHLQLIWFIFGLIVVGAIFGICGVGIMLFAWLKRATGWLIGKDSDLWEPFPRGPRFWNWLIYATLRAFLPVEVRISGKKSLQRLDPRGRAIVFANHPTEIEFPLCYRLMFEHIPLAMLSTQAGWNRYLIMGPLFDLAGSAILLRRAKDGYNVGEGRTDLRDGLRKLFAPGKSLTIHPDSSRPSPSRIHARNEKYGTDFRYIVAPRSGGVKTILDHLDEEGIRNVPIVLYTSGFGFRVETKSVTQWFRVRGKVFFADFDVVSSDSLPRDEQALGVWLGAWASGCDSKLHGAAIHNGFAPE